MLVEIYLLEQQVGVPLFDRENKKIRLNENGLMAADYAARILSLEEEKIPLCLCSAATWQ